MKEELRIIKSLFRDLGEKFRILENELVELRRNQDEKIKKLEKEIKSIKK